MKLWLVERNEQFSRLHNGTLPSYSCQIDYSLFSDSTVHVIPSWKEKYVDYIDTYIETR